MANTPTNLLRTWLANGLAVLRNSAALAGLVARDFDMKPMERGDRVRIPLPPIRTAATVVPAMFPPEPGDSNFDKVEIILDQWKVSSFGITDMELSQFMAGEYFETSNMESAVSSLMDGVVDSIWAKATGANGFYSYLGTAGTNPFATNADALIDASKVLTDNKAPYANRVAIFNTTAVAAAKKLTLFQDADKMGDQSVKREGFLGRVFGFDTFEDQQVPLHTSGTGAGYLVNSVLGTVGQTVLAVDTGTGTLLAGDIITFAGQTQTYRITSSVGGGTVTSITFFPGLVSAVSDNSAITVKATFRTNIAMQKGAIQLVTRPLAGITEEFAKMVGASQLLAQTQMADPITGVSVRASVYRGYFKTGVYLDVLYGSEVVRPEWGVIIAG